MRNQLLAITAIVAAMSTPIAAQAQGTVGTGGGAVVVDDGTGVTLGVGVGEDLGDAQGEFNWSMQHRLVEASLTAPRRPQRESSTQGPCGVGC